MAVQESTVINASVEQVIEAFSNEDFARFVCSEVGVEFGSFSVSGDTSAEFTATTERTVPAERVPDIARKFVGNGVAMTQMDTVSAPAADGSRTVSTEVKVNGVPVSAQATQKLTPEGEQTRLDLKGERLISFSAVPATSQRRSPEPSARGQPAAQQRLQSSCPPAGWSRRLHR